MNGARYWVPIAITGAALLTVAVAASVELGFSRSVTPGLITHYERRHGSGVRARLEGWKGFVRGVTGQSTQPQGKTDEPALLRLVNGFFNRIPAATDPAIWGVEEYWATPSESLSINAADCEDFAIAKYFTLKELGIPVSRLRMVYARTWRSSEAHMVLAYYPEPNADPFVLDNLFGSIQRASNRPDLTPIYAFNDDDVQVMLKGQPAGSYSSRDHRKWRDLLAKLERELTH